jgi:hypothetical protein
MRAANAPPHSPEHAREEGAGVFVVCVRGGGGSRLQLGGLGLEPGDFSVEPVDPREELVLAQRACRTGRRRRR